MKRIVTAMLIFVYTAPRCYGFLPPDFSSMGLTLPDPTHKEPYEPHEETSGGTTNGKTQTAVNLTSVEERVAALEKEIRDFVPRNSATGSSGSSSSDAVDELKSLVKQVSDKEPTLLAKLSSIATKLDGIEEDALARSNAASEAEKQRSAKAESDSTSVDRISEKYTQLEEKLQDVQAAAASFSATKNAIYQQIDERTSTLANAMGSLVDDKMAQVEEHKLLVSKRADGLEGHCKTLDLQGLKAMEEARASLVVTDFHRATEAYASSTTFGTRPENIIDGNLASRLQDRSLLETTSEDKPWCMIKLARRSVVSAVRITSRGDCCHERVYNSEIRVLAYISDKGFACAYINDEIGPGETYLAKCRYGMTGSYVRIQRMVPSAKLNLAEVQAIGSHLDIVADKAAIQSSTEDVTKGAVMALDSDPNTCSETRPYETDKHQYWLVDLEKDWKITAVEITNRNDENYWWLNNVKVDLFTTFPDDCTGSTKATPCDTYNQVVQKGFRHTISCPRANARYVKISIQGQNAGRLSLCEVNVRFSEW